MTNRLIAGTLAIVAVAFLLLVKHDSDAKRDGRIGELDRQLVVLRHQNDSLAQRSDSIGKLAVAKSDTFRIRDTSWLRHRDTVEKAVDRIVHDTAAADSTKIRELAALVLETTRKADSTIAAARAADRAAAAERIAFAEERAGWANERNTQATEIKLLKAQSRHWGLCAAGGYGVMRTSSGVIQAGPIAGVAICWRY